MMAKTVIVNLPALRRETPMTVREIVQRMSALTAEELAGRKLILARFAVPWA